MPGPDAADSARLVQQQFERQFAETPNLLGVGIGQTADGNRPTLTVLVSEPPIAGALPDTFGGLDVVVVLVGANKAQ
jgi:hypothetical protein